jgi:hypothetical protein
MRIAELCADLTALIFSVVGSIVVGRASIRDSQPRLANISRILVLATALAFVVARHRHDEDRRSATMIEDSAGETPWTVALPEQAQPQDERFVFLRDGQREEIHLHDYARIYTVPGLYEDVVQDLLQCRSPTVAVGGVIAAAAELGRDIVTLRVLDLGAGVGLIGELLRAAGVSPSSDWTISQRPATLARAPGPAYMRTTSLPTLSTPHRP